VPIVQSACTRAIAAQERAHCPTAGRRDGVVGRPGALVRGSRGGDGSRAARRGEATAQELA
jgi:hypothetical protein